MSTTADDLASVETQIANIDTMLADPMKYKPNYAGPGMRVSFADWLGELSRRRNELVVQRNMYRDGPLCLPVDLESSGL